MGCHTWFYKKVEDLPEIDDAIKYCKREIKVAMKELTDELDNIEDKFKSSVLELLNNSIEYQESLTNGSISEDEALGLYVQLRLGELERISDELNKNNPNYYSIGVHIVYNDSLYLEVKEVHDIFRVYGYPKDILTSYEETVRYIETKLVEGKAEVFDYTYKELKKFFEEYPDGIIEFG